MRSHTPSRGRNYLRVRGEYAVGAVEYLLDSELPPRARRIRLETTQMKLKDGTTSACAENTSTTACRRMKWWNYLRVRGEYLVTAPILLYGSELPPRARRIRFKLAASDAGMGTTSACAENTP